MSNKETVKRNKRSSGYWWNPNNVLVEIKQRIDNGKDLKPSVVSKEDYGLVKAATDHFGNWASAIIETENHYNIKIDDSFKIVHKKRRTERRPSGYFNDDNIIQEIKIRAENNLDLNASGIKKDDPSLYKTACDKFGSWEIAISKAGLNIDDIRKVKEWDRQTIINSLLKRYYDGHQMNVHAIQNEDNSLFIASYTYFGSYESAINSCGLNYDEIKIIRNEWDRYKIIKLLQDRYTNKLPMNASIVIREESQLFYACCRYFGDYESAIKSAGLDYNEIREDYRTLKFYGTQFEIIVDDLLLELGIPYTKGFNQLFKPDYITYHNRWLDAKLSEWSIYSSDTIRNYEPLCRMLTIIYLRGNKDKDIMITHKTRLISVYKYIKQLPMNKQQYYIDLTDQILDEIDNLNIKE